MRKHHMELVARMGAKVSTIINVHCIAHCEALAKGDATTVLPKF